MEIIANRQLAFNDEAGQKHDIKVEIAKPEEDQGIWKGRYKIAGAYNHAGDVYGSDSVQALLLSMQAVAAHLNTPKFRGRVTMLAHDSHGFPEPSPPR